MNIVDEYTQKEKEQDKKKKNKNYFLVAVWLVHDYKYFSLTVM